MTEPIENVNDPRMVRALSHPLRVRILAILDEQVASPIEISRMLRAELGVVAYHVRTLHRLGMLELVKEVPVRGALQRFFRAVERPVVSREAWENAAPVAKQALIGATIQQIHDYAQGSNAYGGFDRADAHITRTPLKLDEEGFEQVAKVLMKVFTEVRDIEREAADRQAGKDEPELFDAGLAMMLFEAIPFSARPPVEEEDGARRSSKAERVDA
jgi:DNA-binding transcriptional ArsR family regulator